MVLHAGSGWWRSGLLWCGLPTTQRYMRYKNKIILRILLRRQSTLFGTEERDIYSSNDWSIGGASMWWQSFLSPNQHHHQVSRQYKHNHHCTTTCIAWTIYGLRGSIWSAISGLIEEEKEVVMTTRSWTSNVTLFLRLSQVYGTIRAPLTHQFGLLIDW